MAHEVMAMRVAKDLLSLSFSLSLLVLASAAQAQVLAATPGYLARGTATVIGPRGSESGAITVAAWGEGHCKITIALGGPGARRRYTAVVNGNHASISAPAGMAATAPLPLGPQVGCALLPQGLAYDKLAAGSAASLAADAAGRPVSLAWTVPAAGAAQAATLAYGGYQTAGGASYPATVTESVGGETRLQVHFTSFEPHSFAESDFALPPPPKDFPTRTTGGGQ